MIDHAALYRAFHHFARALLASYDVGPMLYLLVDQCVEVLGVDGAGVSLGEGPGTLAFVAATDADVTAIEEQQVATSEGPCHLAFATGEQVVVTDLQQERRWPAYRRVAHERGVRTVVGVPMPVGDQRIGALNLYHGTAHQWTPDELEVAQTMADMASGYILNGRSLAESRTLSQQLQYALDSRIVVEQAKGVLAERHGIAPAVAFERLRRSARSSNRRIHDLAQGVLDGDLEP